MPASEPVRGTLKAPRLSAWLFPIGAGLSFALLMAAAFPGMSWWPATVVAPAPLVAVAVMHSNRRWGASSEGASRVRRYWCAFRTPVLVSLGVLPLQLHQHQFIINISAFGFFPLAAAMSLMVGLFVGLTAYIHGRLPRLPLTLLVPLVWTGLEVFRGEILGSGYSWLEVAYPLIDAPVAPQIGSVVGAYGVGFIVTLVSGIAADVLFVRSKRLAWPIAGGVFACGLAALAIVTAPIETNRPPMLRLAVVQTNIPQDNKIAWELPQRVRDFDRFLELTSQAAAATPKPDLIAWPETMFPGAFLDPAAIESVHRSEVAMGREFEGLTYFAERLAEFQGQIGIPMLIGAMGFDNARLVQKGEDLEIEDDGRYNSAFLIRGGKVEPTRYDKMALTPFGEVMPGFRYWPWLQRQVLGLAANGMAFDLSEGKGPRAFSVEPGPVSIVTPICFEITKPGVCRQLVLAADHRPTIILNLTNDGWFGGFDPAREQHLQIARWRAAELGVSVVRAANTGISAAIGPTGRVLGRGIDGSPSGARVDGTLTLEVPARAAATIYSRTGDVLGWSALAGTALALVLARVCGHRGRGVAV